MFLLAFGGVAAEPFWKTKERVYDRVKNGEIIVSVKTLEPKGKIRELVVQGGGHVAAPAAFVLRKAIDFEQMGKMSGYIKSTKWDPAARELEIVVGAFGQEGRLKMSIKIDEQARPRRVDYFIMAGGLQGMTGAFVFDELSALKTEVAFESSYKFEKFPLAKLFLEFGLEVAFQRMAASLRAYVEDEFKKSS